MIGPSGTRTPGRQLRRRHRGMWIGFATCVLLGLLMAGLAVWVARAWSDDGDSGAFWGAAILGAMALLSAGLAWYLWRKIHPLSLKNVDLSVTPSEVPRGGQVRARVTSTGSRSPGATLEVALLCIEYYDVKVRVSNPNGSDYDQRTTREHELHRETKAIDGATVDASFEVPADAPFSYEGECLSAVWRVRALERRPNRRDRYRDEQVWVQA